MANVLKPFDWLLGRFSVDMGIDLGTANTLVTVKGRGIVLNEPSVVAVNRDTGEVLNDGQAVGEGARTMLGRTPGRVRAVRPLKDGVIADFEIAEKMLRYFIRKAAGSNTLVKPRVVISVPIGVTTVARRAVIQSAERAGARKVHLVDEPLAAAVGIGLPVADARGCLIIDIGGGTTEIAVLALAEAVVAASLPVAGDEMNETISKYLRSAHNLLIGELTSESIKINIGSAWPLEQELEMEVKGRDSITGLPRTAVVNSIEIREALKAPVEKIAVAIRQVLEQAPPEISADLVDVGAVVVGGGALLPGIDKAIQSQLGIHTRIGDDPLTAVARGTGVFLENLDVYSAALASDSEN